MRRKPDPMADRPRSPGVAPARHNPAQSKPYQIQPMDIEGVKAARGMRDVRDAPGVDVVNTISSQKVASAGEQLRGTTSVRNIPSDGGGYLKDSLGRPVNDSSGNKIRVKEGRG